MRDADDKGSDLRKVALVGIVRLEHFKLDHVTIVAAQRKTEVE